MKKLFVGMVLAGLSATAAAAPSACGKLVNDGMTLSAYTAQCAAYGDEARYRRFVKATAANFNQINTQNCRDTEVKSKDGLPHPAARILGKAGSERTPEVLAFCVEHRRQAEQLLRDYGA